MLPPTGAHRRQSPRARRAVGGAAPRKPAPGDVVTVVSGGGDSSTTSSTSKELSKSSDASSSNNNDIGVEPVCPLVIPEYVEFGAVIVTTAAPAEAATVEPAAAAAVSPQHAAEPAPAHEYCYTTAPTLPPAGAVLPAAAEMEPVVQESPPVPPSSTSSSRRGAARSGRERPVLEGSTETVARPRCVYCQEPFELTANRRGACPDAPENRVRVGVVHKYPQS